MMLRRIRHIIASLIKDSEASIAIPVALAMPLLIGVAALALDMSWAQGQQIKQRGVAEMAALAAFNARLDGATVPQAQQVAYNLAASNGYTNGANGVTVTANNPPASGPNAGNTAAYEVIINAPRPTWFSGIFGTGNTTVTGRGVALPNAVAPPCLLTLYDGSSGYLMLTGSASYGASFSNTSATITAPNCAIASNDAVKGFNMTTAKISASLVTTPANISLTFGNITAAILTKAPPTPDPWANFSLSIPARCDYTNLVIRGSNNPPDQTIYNLSPGVYCGGIAVSTAWGIYSTNRIVFAPGVYYFVPSTVPVTSAQTGWYSTGTIPPGALIGNGSSILDATSGVTLVFSGSSVAGSIPTGAQISFTTLNALNIVAPTTGPTAGLAIYFDRNMPTPAQQNPVGLPSYAASLPYIYNDGISLNGGTFSITGDIYMPTQIISYTTGNFTMNCGRIIAWAVGGNTGTYTFNNPLDGTCPLMKSGGLISKPSLGQ